MTKLIFVAALLAAFLFIYLLYVLIRPEKF